MPVNSINTNTSALVALQALNATNRELDTVQDRISTGLKVTGAVDDASSFSIAQGIRSDLKSYSAVSQGISNAKGLLTVTLAGVTTISDLLGDIKKKVIEGMNPANTSEQQAILAADYVELIAQIERLIENSTYNSRNLLVSGATDVNVISNIDGATIPVRANDLAAGQDDLATNTNLDSVANATSALDAINTYIGTVNTVLGNLGADSRTISFQDQFISVLDDATTTGLGDIVDADLAKESARLQAIQVKQQLGTQTLSIANQRPQVILQLFGG
ncbi:MULTISPECIES: flagellin [Oceanibaculum]|uniref:Flagellin n=2 Tax=Oceanibaculum indicum TaxID=526216 RepID=K2JKM4_9PROT|nr:MULTISPECIES: flagellin [Oceanibaculum]EKE75002.1 flagellin domain-containing protein [Oceanibaculum indicum P24]MCH2394902.1 flagellin [Oceanibaculum sp.]RKQ72678.1 flagellin [Oceanibaculum indicum]